MLKNSVYVALLAAPIALISPALAQTSASIPDVRGLEYREVTLQKPVAISSNYIPGARFPAPPPIRLWIAPAQNGETPRGLGWNGVVYELKNIGEMADWRADVEARLKPRVEGTPYYWPRPFEFSGGLTSQEYLERLDAPELLKKARLQRLRYRDSDSQTEYQGNLRDAGVSSFVGGQFSQAKAQLQTLLAVLPSATPRNGYDPRPEATRILADIARRENDAPRPADEIAGLIWDLQNVGTFGGWGFDSVLRKLVDAGDRAVEPLLDALENDARLTLAVRVNNFRAQRFEPIATVRDAAHEALNILLKHRYYSTEYNQSPETQAREIAAQMRADWEKMKAISPVERVFAALSQSGQSPEKLESAARELVRIGKPYQSNTIYVEKKNGVYIPLLNPRAFFGEPLRGRQNPSVNDLLEARIAELSSRALMAKSTPSAESYEPQRALQVANFLALTLAKWDAKRAASLLGTQLERNKRFAAKSSRDSGEEAQRGSSRARRDFLVARLGTPFQTAALREYGEFLKSQPFGRFSEADYVPLWRFPNDPAIQNATRALFAPDKTPFQSAAQFKTSDFNHDSAFQLLYSPLVRLPLVKAALARELGNRTIVGSVKSQGNGVAEIAVSAWNWGGPKLKQTPARLENGAFQPLRVCDLIGFRLMESRLDAQKNLRYFPLLDVSLPTPKRDARLKGIAILLAQNRVAMRDFGFENSN